MKKNIILFLFLFNCFYPAILNAQPNEFYGPFSSWVNLKEVYHAAGDGIHDDTKALQAALDELGQGNNPPVLFIPKGTYRITATLTMKTRIGISVIGEDALTTIIKWNGPAKQKMFLLDGVAYSEFARITWDGSGTALAAVAHEWDGIIRYANSGTRHTDEIFKNLAVGIKSGLNMDAEFTIRRCRFYNCSSTGISLQGWNALDWWIWDCFFQDCRIGVANNFPSNGAGNFHVYRSTFIRSYYTDICLGNSNYFSFRDNVSYNSNQFISANQFSNTSPITIQHNLIICQYNKIMAYLFTKGNVLFLDNTFAMPAADSNYVIQAQDNFNNTHPDITLIGNKFTVKQKIIQTNAGRFINIDNTYGIASPPMPSLDPKPFEILANYPVYEVTDKMATAAIQSIINEAAAKNKKAVIHFRYGNYSITQTLQIPAGAPLVLMGDGLGSILNWAGSTGAVIEVKYPAQIIIRSIKIDGKSKADGILVQDADKPGDIIYADELLAYAGVNTNILINGIANTDLRFENLQHNYCSKGISVNLVGAGQTMPSTLKIFGCACVDNSNTYQTSKSGRIIAYDEWYEDSNDSNFITLKGDGEFILNGAKIANTNAAKAPFINIDGFGGKVVLAQVIYNSQHKSIRFSNESGKGKFLTLGTLNWDDSTENCYTIKSNSNDYANISNRYNIGKGSYPVSDMGNKDTAFIKDMLADMRHTLVSDTPKYVKTASHFIVERVMVQNGINNFRVEKQP